MTDPLGQSQVLPYIIELTKKGYCFTLLSFEKKEKYWSEKNIIEKITRENSINWVPLFFTAKPPVLSKMFDRWRMLRKASQMHRKEKFDVIHCRSYVSAEAGLKLKKESGVKFLFDMRGFWADERVDNGQWDLKKFFYKRIYNYYKKKEKDFLLSADAIVSLTTAAKDLLLARQEYKDLYIEVIPCCADLDHFNFNRISLEQSEQFRSSLGISSEKKIITYLGSIGGWYMTNEMFAFFKRLLQRHPEFMMLFLTKDLKENVITAAKKAGIDDEKVIVHYAKRAEVPDYLSISDCSIFFIRPTFSKTASSPTKHAELMGMGIPVICNDIGDTGKIAELTGTGAVVKSFSDNEYDTIVDRLPQLLAIPQSDIRNAAFDFFDLQKGAEKYSILYSKILKSSSEA